MAILAKRPKSTFEACPEGLHHAVCCDVVDLGLVETAFGLKHQVRIVWQTEELRAETVNGKPGNTKAFLVNQLYTNSLHEKAKLRQHLEAWRGRRFTDEELDGFDLEKLINVNCQIQVVHNVTDAGGTFANVQAVVPAPRNTARLAVHDYVRVKDRERNGEPVLDNELEGDSVPF